MAVNVPLQKRAGLNIGIEEPNFAPFLQDGGGKETQINPVIGAETVILECPAGSARSVNNGSENQGMIFNTSAANFSYEVLFQDTLGNKLELNTGTVNAGEALSFVYQGKSAPLVLVPGEKILLKAAQGGPV